MSPPAAIRVGGEIDAFCTRCDLNLAHSIIAILGAKVVKVKCNTCDSEHVYRGTQPLMKTTSTSAPRKSATGGAVRTRAPSVKMSWEDQFAGKDLSRAKKYSPRETFVVDDVVDHPTFGLGLVMSVRVDKVDISFKQETKTLVHGKAPAP